MTKDLQQMLKFARKHNEDLTKQIDGIECSMKDLREAVRCARGPLAELYELFNLMEDLIRQNTDT